jgi:hypothetical protein
LVRREGLGEHAVLGETMGLSVSSVLQSGGNNPRY